MILEGGSGLNGERSSTKLAPEKASQSSSGVSPEKAFTTDERPSISIKRKLWVIVVFIVATIFAAYLASELYTIQVVQHDQYALLASRMHWRRIRDIPIRGDILDANGNVLASTTYEYTVGVTPKDVRSIKSEITDDEIAAKLAVYLHLDVKSVREALNNKEATYIQLAKKISRDDIDLLKTFMSDYSLGGIKMMRFETLLCLWI